jgi:HD-GYP domain-containing protein (c-di-GMP phosphodiesterase class II)
VPDHTQRIVRALGRVLAAKQTYLADHAAAVARRVLALDDTLGLFRGERAWLAIAGRVHDIGLVAISDLVVLKPDTLSDQERHLITAHPVAGYHILGELAIPELVCEAVLYHHERLDGSGYPQGLIGPEIPLASRLVAVADVFEAMVAERPWRKALPVSEALAELTAMAGSRLEPRMVEALVDRVREDRSKKRQT